MQVPQKSGFEQSSPQRFANVWSYPKKRFASHRAGFHRYEKHPYDGVFKSPFSEISLGYSRLTPSKVNVIP
jgi:hypothetical protein